MTYRIRQATPNDAASIYNLIKEIWQKTSSSQAERHQLSKLIHNLYSIEKITENLKEKIEVYILLSEQEQLVAFITFSYPSKAQENFRVHKLYSMPNTQGKGYAKLLLQVVENKAIGKGSNLLEIEVNRKSATVDYYQKLGFEMIANDLQLPGTVPTDSLLLRKMIKPK